MCKIRIAALMAAFTFVCTQVAAAAAPSMRDVLRITDSLRDYSNVAISPDGTHVAWQQTHRHADTLWIEDLATRTAVRLTAGAGVRGDETWPVWSPDGSRIAFFSETLTKDRPSLYVARANGSDAHMLAPLGGLPQRLTWSPDGKHLAFLYIAKPHRLAGALAPGARDVGVIGSVSDEQQIATVDAASGTLRLVSPSQDYVYEYAWSPDSKRFACTYARGNGDNNWWVAKLALVAAGGGAMRDLLAPNYQINDPTWSPDGSKIAVIGGLMSDFGSVGGDVYLVDAASGAATDVTPDAKFNAADLHWVQPARILVVAHVLGALHVLALDPSNGSTTTLLGGAESIRSLSLARDAGRVALVRLSFSAPPEVWAGPFANLRRITSGNENVPKLTGKAISLTWKSDSYTVQGWLIYPLDFDPNKKYPMVMIVHGGPSAESLPNYDYRFSAALTARGYFVLEPNPRGSFGQGEAYTSANIKDFGYGDWRDDLAGIDAAVAAAPIDPNRLGLFGWSYGGYMAMWAQTQTRRFKAIVAGAGVVNWQSYYGQNKIDQWMIPFFGASVYDDPAVYAKSSPITFIKNSHTPVLILQGERDEEVPAPQAFEFYHAMQALGVPSQLVVYADEGHSPRKPKDQIDIMERTAGWFDKYLR
ncbi:MAG TPA: S9 family peptidase [Candidatus Acidoferrales bacterium]|nr:S9 family peptidase [Candidatus Acidoferrales bacterium]